MPTNNTDTPNLFSVVADTVVADIMVVAEGITVAPHQAMASIVICKEDSRAVTLKILAVIWGPSYLFALVGPPTAAEAFFLQIQTATTVVETHTNINIRSTVAQQSMQAASSANHCTV